MKGAILSIFAGLTAVVLMAGCSGTDADSSHGAGTANAASAVNGMAAEHVATTDDGIAGVLQWTGDSSGRHAYATADCSKDGKFFDLTAPYWSNDEKDGLAVYEQPVLHVQFPYHNKKKYRKPVAVGFYPQPKNVTKQNSFIGSEKSAGSVSWSKKGDTYVVHLRHLDAISADIKDSPAEGYPEHDYHAYLTGDLTCTTVNGDKVKG